MSYHLVYFRDFLDKSLPFWTMQCNLGVYDNIETPVSICKIQNIACGNLERFQVYESPTKNLTNKSKKVYE